MEIQKLLITLDVNGIVNFNNTTNSNATNNGALVVDGGVGISKNLNVGVKLLLLI